MLKTIYLSLGSNLGERLENLKKATQELGSFVNVKKQASIYETLPWGNTEQGLFLNTCLQAETTLSAPDLLKTIKQIEVKLGRVPSTNWGPRLIDIDLLFYEDEILDTQDLKIPHPHLQERQFVLKPLADIAPNLKHPILKKTIIELSNANEMESIHLYNGDC